MLTRCFRLALLVSLFAAVACSDDTAETSPADDVAADVANEIDVASDAVSDLADAPDAVGDVASDAPDPSDAPDLPDAEVDPDLPPPTWRSALYPEDWTPSLTDEQGRFFHDFSYAGYHHAERELGAGFEALESTIVDVVADHAADPTGSTDSTAAFQAAIDVAELAAAESSAGGVVAVPEGLYRIDGVLRVDAPRVVIRGQGPELSRLHFTRFDGMSYQSHLTVRGDLSSDLELLLAEDATNRATDVAVADASGLAVGDEVALGWVITDDFIADHEMTGTWQAFNGDWQPFFRRRVVAIDTSADPHTVTLDVPLRYDALVRDDASLRRQLGTLSEVGVEGIGVANAVAWDDAWSVDQVHAIELDGVVDGWVRDVHSFVSPGAPESGPGAGDHLQSGGIIVRRSNRVTVADSVMEDAQHRGGGGNGYLFEVRQSSEVLFRDCVGVDGRHNFIQNWGFGATGIVWLRIDSSGGRTLLSSNSTLGGVGYSEFHHSLAMANLIDQSRFSDGWSAVNRNAWSTGAGHTATQSVVWNATGFGDVRSAQYGWGYVVGTARNVDVDVSIDSEAGSGTAPEDWVEGRRLADTLEPQSLYEDQLARRLGER